MSNAGKDEWYTPKPLIEALGRFDLDPAAPSRDHWTADECWTKEEDGLSRSWGEEEIRKFLNPPYSEPDPWVDKLVVSRNAIALFFARMDTIWMHRALDGADAAFFLKGRISFINAVGKKAGSAPAPSVLLAYGANNVEAIEEAAAKGLIKGKMFFERSKARKFILPEERKLITGADLGFNKLAAD